MGRPGGFLLVATALAALASAASSAVAWRRPDAAPRAVPAGRWLLALTAALAVAATLALAWALVTNDFSLTYVADHSRRRASGAYRLAGLWGGMAGSLLLWTALLAIVAAIGARTARSARSDRTDRAAGATATTVLALVTAAFATTTLVLANPFETLAVPAVDGGGLTPILEHPAMLYHPPLLYLGLVTLAVPFALTIGGLVTARPDDAAVRRWMLASWTLLVAGMVTGANWAYVEVGWGGYWAWDPIENTALVPWLVTTAYLHARLRDRPAGPGARRSPTPDALVLLAFVLASVGTLLTRSGAASSVHAFAQATAVGRALLVIVMLLLVGSAAALRQAIRREAGSGSPRGRPAGTRWWPASRDSLLAVQIALVLVAVALVLTGMLAPIAREWVTGAESVVDGAFYARVVGPLAVVALLLTGIGPRLAPGVAAGRALARDLGPPAIGAIATLVLFAALGWHDPATLALAGAAGFAAASALPLGGRAVRARVPVAAHVAHLGVAVLLLGVAGSTAATSRTVSVGPGATVAFDGLELRHEGAHTEPGPPPRVVTPVVITRRGASRSLAPAIDGYPERGSILAETALWSTPLEDVQVALRRADDDGQALFDVRVRPLAQLVWWGGVLLALSGALALRPALARGRGRPEIGTDTPALRA